MFRGYALIVTVEAYDSQRVGDLGDRVRADGDDLVSLLSDTELCGYGTDRICRLSGSDATANRVLAALSDIKSKARFDDPVLFFFSGHGEQALEGETGRSSLLAYDYDPNTGIGRIEVDSLAWAWSSIRSHRKLFIADACFSGGLSIPKSSSSTGKLGLSSDLLDRLASGRGSVAIASSRADETSVILPGDRNSLFTKHLLHGLRGAAGHDSDGFVRVFDLFTYTTERVQSEHRGQRPVYAAYHQDSNFPVSYCASLSRRKSRHCLSAEPVSLNDLPTLTGLFAVLYPSGPGDLSVWERAGGDISRLTLTGNGRNDWFQALKTMNLGGGGEALRPQTLFREALLDYPYHPQLLAPR